MFRCCFQHSQTNSFFLCIVFFFLAWLFCDRSIAALDLYFLCWRIQVAWTFKTLVLMESKRRHHPGEFKPFCSFIFCYCVCSFLWMAILVLHWILDFLEYYFLKLFFFDLFFMKGTELWFKKPVIELINPYLLALYCLLLVKLIYTLCIVCFCFAKCLDSVCCYRAKFNYANLLI